MREAEFKREMNRNYMILEPEPGVRETYTLRMLSCNEIGGLLPFQEKQMDGKSRYYYDITSRQPLGRILEYRSITAEEIRQLVAGILLALRQMERFLLDESQLCLEPEMIYVEPDSFRVSLCLIPGERRSFTESFLGLSQYLLDHVNHNDGDAVVLAFGLLKESRKENFGIGDIEKCLGEEGKKPGPLGKEKREPEEEERIPVFWGSTGLEEKNEENESGGGEGKPGDCLEERRYAVAGIFAFFMAAVPAALWFLMGEEFLFRYRLALGGAELFLAVALAFFLAPAVKGVRKREKIGDMGEKEEPWEVVFRENGDLIPADGKAPGRLAYPEKSDDLGKMGYSEKSDNSEQMSYPEQTGYLEQIGYPEQMGHREKLEHRKCGNDTRAKGSRKRPGNGEEEEMEEFQTVLLTGKPVFQTVRKLVPIEGGEEIPIRYFPFLIGKSKTLADFCLNLPEISRLHLKIEEADSGYVVTDLNSTNGTAVDGRLLETNETCPLPIGAELAVASKRFRFL